MDLFTPTKLRAMSLKQLQEARAEIQEEIADLETAKSRSSLQEVGLRNLRASLEIADETLLTHGDGSIRFGRRDGQRLQDDPLEKPGRGRQGEKSSEKYMTYRAIDGSPVYAVGKGQRFADIPGHESGSEPFALGSLIRAALTGNRSGLSGDLRAALNEAVGAQGGYLVPSVLSTQIIDLARARSVLIQAGMTTIALTSDNLKIARVTADPTFSEKIENELFAEDDTLRFGAISIVPKMQGCLIRASIESIEDASNFSMLIEEAIAKAFAASIDNKGLNGVDGTQSPTGIFSFPEIANTDVAEADLDWLSLSAAALAVKNRNHQPSAALMNHTREHALRESRTSTGDWLGPPPTLKNVAMPSSTAVPAANKIIGDFSKFSLGLRTGLRIDFTDVGAGAFERNQRVFRVYWRGNFAVLDETAFQKITITA